MKWRYHCLIFFLSVPQLLIAENSELEKKFLERYEPAAALVRKYYQNLDLETELTSHLQDLPSKSGEAKELPYEKFSYRLYYVGRDFFTS